MKTETLQKANTLKDNINYLDNIIESNVISEKSKIVISAPPLTSALDLSLGFGESYNFPREFQNEVLKSVIQKAISMRKKIQAEFDKLK